MDSNLFPLERAKEAEETAQRWFDALTQDKLLVDVVALKAAIRAFTLTSQFRADWIIETWEASDESNKDFINFIAKRLQLRWEYELESSLNVIGLNGGEQRDAQAH